MPSIAHEVRRFDPAFWRSVEVARIVGCSDSYVRTVWQRRNPKRLRQDAAYCVAIKRTGDRECASRAFRKAYAEARHKGASRDEARLEANRKRLAVLSQTYDRAKAAKAWRAAGA